MANFGAKVSLPGYDVKTCADRFLVFSSDFPVLKVFGTYSVTTTIPSSGENTITITHNLGYLAPYLVVYNGSTTTGTNTSNLMSDNDSYLTTYMYSNSLQIEVDEYFDQYESSVGDTVYFTVYIFLDKLESYTADIIKTDAGTVGSAGDYGIKVSKAGFDVKTCADENLVLSSSFFSGLIHKKGLLTSSEVSHNLNYVPPYLCYEYDSANSRVQTNNLSFQNIQKITANKLFYDSSVGTGDGIYYIIFKNTA